MILGQAIGRWGNYFNMEVYGTQTTLPWAISVADPALGIIQVHPLFLYESLWNSAGFVLLLCYDKYLKKITVRPFVFIWYFIRSADL